MRNGASFKDREEYFEYIEIYHIEPRTNLNGRYVPPQLKTNKIDEFNKMIAKYPTVEIITIYQMNANDFTEKEMAEIAGKIVAPNEECIKTVILW